MRQQQPALLEAVRHGSALLRLGLRCCFSDTECEYEGEKNVKEMAEEITRYLKLARLGRAACNRRVKRAVKMMGPKFSRTLLNTSNILLVNCQGSRFQAEARAGPISFGGRSRWPATCTSGTEEPHHEEYYWVIDNKLK